MSPFQEKLLSLKKRIEGNLPPKYLKVIHKTIRDLERSGIGRHVIKVSERVPEFELENQDGVIINAKEIYEKQPLIITFYRGFWCPYCNLDLSNLQTYMPECNELGAVLLAISPEKPEYSSRIIKRHKLAFDILYDKKNSVAAKFGLIWTMPDDLIELYRDKFSYNLKLYHGDGDWTLPVPSRFLIDTEGVIRYAESTPDYSTRPDPDDLMKVLKAL